MNERREETFEERVLVLAPTERDARICRALLEGAGLHVSVSSGITEICRELSAGAGALLLTEEALEGSQMTALIAELAHQPPWSHLPVLLLTPGGVESRLGAWAMQSIDNVVLLERPIQGQTIISAVSAAIKNRRRQYQMREYLRERESTEAALRASEEGLREKERDLRAMFENAASGIVRTDGQDRFVAVNSRLCQMLGYSKEELLGMSVHELTCPEDRRQSDALNASLREGSLSELKYEKRYMKKDGSPLWVRVAVAAAHDEAGRYLYSVGTVLDIDAQKKAEEELRERERRYRSFVTVSSQAVWRTNASGGIEENNESWCDYTGQTFAQAQGFGWLDAVHPEDRETMSAGWKKAVAARTIYEAEYRLRRKDGSWREVMSRGVPVFSQDGRLYEWVGTCTDISDRKQGERELREAKDYAEKLIETANTLVVGLDSRGRITVVNRAAEEITGYRRDELLNQNWFETVLRRERVSEVREHFQELMRGKPCTTFENPVLTKAGEERSILWQNSTLFDGETPCGVISFGIDVTDRKRAEEALREREKQLRTLADAMPQLAWMAGADGFVHWYNKGWYQYTGTAPEEMEGWGWQRVHDPEMLPEVLERWKASIESGEPFEMVFPLRGADGRYRPFLTRVQPLRNEHGKVLQWFGTNTNIEELKRTEDALRRSEATLSAVLESLPVGIVIAEENGRIVRMNKANQDLWGKPPEETPSWNEYDRWVGYWAETGERIKAQDWALARALRTGEIVKGDLVELEQFGTGGRRVSLNNAAPVRDANGKIIAGVVAQLDLTDRIVSERRLQLSETQFRSFFENAGVGASQIDASGRFVQVNDRYCEITGYSREELIGRSALLLSHPDGLQEDRDALERFCRGEVADYRSERRYVRKDGQVIWVRTVAGLIRDENGRPWRSAAITEDITEIKRAEEALRQSELFHRQTLESIPGMVFTTRPDGYCDYQSQQWTDYTGVPMSEHLGDGWNKLLHPDDRPRALDAWQAAVEETAPYDLEYRIRRHDGAYEWFKVRGEPIRDEEGRIVRWFGVAANIESLKQAEDALKAAQVSAERARAEAERANAAKDEFLAVLSHELRTPLSPVLAAVQLMQRGGELSERGWAHADIIRRNVELEARLIDDLLDLTRIARGKINLNMQDVDIGTVLHRVADICRPEIEAKKLRFAVHFDGGLHSVTGDASRLQQVIWNLVNNSIKFTQEGGCIRICSYPQNGEVVMEVNDSGIGIDPDILPIIFNAFEQGDRRITRQFGGLGLGLAITKRLVELHGGTISAESGGKNQGATFRVALPIAPKRADNVEDKVERMRAEGGQRARRILLVEDHNDTATMMKALLEHAGYQVQVAADVAQALQAAEGAEFDLLISDLGLPDGSGIQLIEELRRRENGLRAIALSGYGREDDVRRSKEAGFSEHITKPVDFEALLRAVEGAG